MIVIVSELYYPEDTSTGYILTKIAEGLAKKYPVHVLTGRPDYSIKQDALQRETKNNVGIERISIPSFNKNKIVSRIFRSILLSVGLSWKTARLIKKNDVVLVVTNPAPILILISLVCKIAGVPFIILVHDVFPDNLEASQLLEKDSLAFRVLFNVFNRIYAASDHVVTIGRDMKKIIEDRLSTGKSKVNVITNWADINDIVSEERSSNELIQQYNLAHYFIIEFAGNIGRVQGVEYLVTAAEILKLENIHFLFVGNGAKREFVKAEMKARGLKNITMIDTLPRSQQQTFLNACDVGLVSLAPGMAGLGVPSKTYNILAAGKPVIAVVDATSEIGLLVTEEKIGWVVPPGDPEALAAAILEAKNHPALSEMGRIAREVAVTKYSLSKVIDHYTDLFASYV